MTFVTYSLPRLQFSRHSVVSKCWTNRNSLLQWSSRAASWRVALFKILVPTRTRGTSRDDYEFGLPDPLDSQNCNIFSMCSSDFVGFFAVIVSMNRSNRIESTIANLLLAIHAIPRLPASST